MSQFINRRIIFMLETCIFYRKVETLPHHFFSMTINLIQRKYLHLLSRSFHFSSFMCVTMSEPGYVFMFCWVVAVVIRKACGRQWRQYVLSSTQFPIYHLSMARYTYEMTKPICKQMHSHNWCTSINIKTYNFFMQSTVGTLEKFYLICFC